MKTLQLHYPMIQFLITPRLHLSMFDGSLMLQVNWPVVMIRFPHKVTSLLQVWRSGGLKLNDSPACSQLNSHPRHAVSPASCYPCRNLQPSKNNSGTHPTEKNWSGWSSDVSIPPWSMHWRQSSIEHQRHELLAIEGFWVLGDIISTFSWE